jgi:hypothetical protein
MKMPKPSSTLDDAAQVKQLGYEQELQRNHSRWFAISLLPWFGFGLTV